MRMLEIGQKYLRSNGFLELIFFRNCAREIVFTDLLGNMADYQDHAFQRKDCPDADLNDSGDPPRHINLTITSVLLLLLDFLLCLIALLFLGRSAVERSQKRSQKPVFLTLP